MAEVAVLCFWILCCFCGGWGFRYVYFLKSASDYQFFTKNVWNKKTKKWDLIRFLSLKKQFKWNFFGGGIFHHDIWIIFKSARNSWSFYAPNDLLQGQNFHLSEGPFFTIMTQKPIFGKTARSTGKKPVPSYSSKSFAKLKK